MNFFPHNSLGMPNATFLSTLIDERTHFIVWEWQFDEA
jgi:hypothetical protein